MALFTVGKRRLRCRIGKKEKHTIEISRDTDFTGILTIRVDGHIVHRKLPFSLLTSVN